MHYNVSMNVTELEIFEHVAEMIELNEYPKPLIQRLLYYFEKTNTKSWRNKNQESFLILIALEGPEKVLEQMKSTLAVLAALSTLFLSITVPLSLEPGDFSKRSSPKFIRWFYGHEHTDVVHCCYDIHIYAHPVRIVRRYGA